MCTLNVAGRLHLLTPDGPVDVGRLSQGRFGPDPQEVYDRWEHFAEWAASHLQPGQMTSALVGLDTLGALASRPRQVFAGGFNYIDHAADEDVKVPEATVPSSSSPGRSPDLMGRCSRPVPMLTER